MKSASPKNNDAYPSKIKHYEKIRIIGKGSYGLVYEARILNGPLLNEHVAVKEMHLDKLDQKKMSHLLVSHTLYTKSHRTK